MKSLYWLEVCQIKYGNTITDAKNVHTNLNKMFWYVLGRYGLYDNLIGGTKIWNIYACSST